MRGICSVNIIPLLVAQLLYLEAQDPAKDIQMYIMSDYMVRSRRRLNRILAENTGRAIAEIDRDTERDYFMDADEALAYGLIDVVLSNDGR